VPVQALSFHPSRNELAIGGYHEITVRDPANGRLLRRITNVTERVHGLAHSPDGSQLAVAGGQPGRGGEVTLYDSSTGDRLRVLARAPDVFLCVAFSPDGRGIAAGGSDQSIRVLDVETGKEKLHIRQHADWVTDVVFNKDGSRIASASRDRSARLYDASTGELLIGYMEHEFPVQAVVFAGDDRVISGDRDGRIHVWKTEDGSRDGRPLNIEGRVLALRVTNEALFSASTDHNVRQHRLDDRKLERSFSGHSDWVHSLALHPSTARLAAGAHNGEVLIWNTETGERLTLLESLATEHQNATAHLRASDPAAGAASQTGNP
jgi:WD40 repeat protein